MAPGEGGGVDVAVSPTRVLTDPCADPSADCDPRRPGVPVGGSSQHCQGSYSPGEAGFARLVWNNSYSRINGKHIAFTVQVVEEDVLQAAFQAAEDTEETSQRARSSVSPTAR